MLRGLAWVMAAGLGAFAAVGARAAGQTFEPITLPTASLNANFGQHFSPLYTDPLYTGDPNYTNLSTTGQAIFGSVPFTIPYKAPLAPYNAKGRIIPTNAQSNFWLSAYEDGGQANGTQTLTVPTSLSQVPEVYALMGCWWGRPGTPSVSVQFSFTDVGGSPYTYTKTLQAGPSNFTLYPPFGVLTPPSTAEIRDFHNSEFKGRYSNVINGTTTQEVWTDTYRGLSDKDHDRQYRMDMVRLEIPYPFNQMKLTEIKVTDTGKWGVQRVFLGAATGNTGHCAQVQLLQSYGSAGVYLQVYRVTNCTNYQWDNPVSLVLKDLQAGVTLTNSSGTATGENASAPYINSTSTNPLLPGQSVVMTLRFSKSTPGVLTGIPFTPKILAGMLPR
jgi:hypothetical protein